MTTRVSVEQQALAHVRAGFFEQTNVADLVRYAVDAISRLGIERVRFYEAVQSSLVSPLTLVGRASAGMDAPLAESFIGYPIEEQDSSLFVTSDWDKPVHESGATCENAFGKAKWVRFLGLQDRDWWDFPVKFGGQKRGLIAIDYPSDQAHIDNDMVWFLSEVAALLGYALETIAQREKAECLRRVNAELSPYMPYQELAQKATSVIREILGAASVAYFEVDPVRMILVKRASSYAVQMKDFYEEYEFRKHLTGHAWDYKKYRLIIDFKTLAINSPEMISRDSLDFHAQLVKVLAPSSTVEINSVIYSNPELGQIPGMFRAINRVDEVRMPFTMRHKNMLDDMSLIVSRVLAERLYMDALTTLADAAEMLQKSPTSQKLIMKSICQAVEVYGIRCIGILCKVPMYIGMQNVAFEGEPLAGIWPAERLTWKSDAFLEKASKLRQPAIIELEPLGKSSHVAKQMLKENVSHVYTVPFQGNVEVPGLFLAVIGSGDFARAVPQKVEEFWLQHRLALTTLDALGLLVGNALEGVQKNIPVISVRKVFAAIGHEFKTPVQVLSSQGSAACMVAEELASRYAPHMLEEIRDYAAEIDYHRDLAGSAVNKAVAMAGKLPTIVEYSLAKTSIGNILERCEKLLRQQCQHRDVRIIIRDNAKKLPSIVLAEHSMVQVFYNLLENAVKYSLPRYPSKPMLVDVQGELRGRMVCIWITNWGMGIAEKDYETIFRGYSRTDVRDERRIIGGLGLGLAIAQRFVEDHGGKIKVQSKFTLNDPVRKKKLEGYESTFTVTLPRDLQAGRRQVRQEE